MPLFASALLENMEEPAYEALLLVGELRALTRWDDRVLLEQLGCDPASARHQDPMTEVMEHSVAYLSWLVELCGLVDRVDDRRDTVAGAFELCAQAGGPLADRVRRCRRAMATAVYGELTPCDLLKLGEVSAAFRQAARGLDRDAESEDARSRPSMSEPLEKLTSHIHPRRLRWLLGDASDREERLGSRVALVMDRHLRDCTRCSRVAAEMGLDPGPAATDAHAA